MATLNIAMENHSELVVTVVTITPQASPAGPRILQRLVVLRLRDHLVEEDGALAPEESAAPNQWPAIRNRFIEGSLWWTNIAMENHNF